MDKKDLKQALIKCIDNDAPFFLMFDDGGVSAVAVNGSQSELVNIIGTTIIKDPAALHILQTAALSAAIELGPDGKKNDR